MSKKLLGNVGQCFRPDVQLRANSAVPGSTPDTSALGLGFGFWFQKFWGDQVTFQCHKGLVCTLDFVSSTSLERPVYRCAVRWPECVIKVGLPKMLILQCYPGDLF